MRNYILLIFLLFSTIGFTQSRDSTKRGLKTLYPSSFAYNLAEGDLVFTKTFLDNGTGLFVPTYTITQKLYKNGLAVRVEMTRASFDNYFKSSAALAASYDRIIKYSEDKKLSFTDENGWAALLKNYNNSVIQ